MASASLRHRRSSELNIFSVHSSQDCYQNHRDVTAASAPLRSIHAAAAALQGYAHVVCVCTYTQHVNNRIKQTGRIQRKIPSTNDSDLINYFGKGQFRAVHKAIHQGEKSPFIQAVAQRICHQFLQSNSLKKSVYRDSPSHVVDCDATSTYTQQFLRRVESSPHITCMFNQIIQ